MQAVDRNKYIIGTFCRELKNRFLCEVVIDNKPTVCYVPSSCHLGNFIRLEGKQVLLKRTATKDSRTDFAVLAVPYKRNYIVLNTSMANRAIETDIGSRRFSFLGKRKSVIKEHSVDGYKADLYIKDTDTIIEIKSVISVDELAIFPSVYSERTQRQLQQIQQLLKQGKRVVFFIVSLNPYVKQIVIDKETEFYSELEGCIQLGLQLFAFSSRFTNGELHISKALPVII